MAETRTIDRLLHDAEHADSGLNMARMMRDEEHVRHFTEKRGSLLRMALALDPAMASEWWDECRWTREQITALATDTPHTPRGEAV